MVKVFKAVASKLIFFSILFATMGVMSQGLGFLCGLDAMPLSEDTSIPAGCDLSYWADVKATQLSREELNLLTEQTERNSEAYKQAVDDRKQNPADERKTPVASTKTTLR